MNEKNFEYLKDQVFKLGFPDRIVEQINDYMMANNPAFHIYCFNQVEEDQLMYDLRFSKGAENFYQLKEYELTYKQINIPDITIQDINTGELEGKLKEANDWYDKFLENGIENSLSGQEYKKVTDSINAMNNDLYRLAEIEKGEETAKLLMFKYFSQSEYEKVFPDYREMQKLHEHKHIFPVNDNGALTAMDAYQLLKAKVNGFKEHYTNTIANNHVNSEFLKGNRWVAYNTASYFLDKNDMYFFKSKDEAIDFVESNISEYDSYRVIKAASVDDVIKQIPYGEQRFELFAESTSNQTNSFTQKTNFMNQKNFDYLKDQVKFTGFGEGLENELKEKMQKQTPEFQITHNTKFSNEELATSLHFKKSDQTDMYFFNRYQVSLTPEQSKDKMERTFYINKEGSITLKEAYKLMNGRSINKDLTNKEGQVYNAWMQMDFKQTDNNGNYKLKQFHQNYGYD